MSEFYINSIKSNLNWQKLDVNDIEDKYDENEILKNNSKFNTKQNYAAELKNQLHNEFSHILNTKNNKNGDTKVNTSYLDEASTKIIEIEKIAGINEVSNSDLNNNSDKSDELLYLLNELRKLTEKRLKISKDITLIDHSLFKLQKRFLDKKREYDKKISDLKSVSSIYTQSATLVSKIISEDTDYEQI